MIMTYAEHLMTALGSIAGFIVLALFWIWLVLVFADAIAQLLRQLGGEFGRWTAEARRHLSAANSLGSSPARKRRRPGSPKTAPADSLSSQLVAEIQRPCAKATHNQEQQRLALNPWDAPGEPSIVEGTPIAATTFAAGVEDASEAVPLFVIDAPLFQADPNVLDARPASLLEILEDTCSAAKAAGYSDEEIARMLAGDSRFPS
jgi:hypothetical protein